MLSSEDRSLLTKKNSTGQEYVLVTRPHEKAAYLVGQTGQGVLYAAASLLQLMTSANDQVRIPAIHIRDFPDFKYRMAADWLSNVEINRWVYDWGDGVEAMLPGSSASWTSVRDTKSTWSWPMDLAGAPNSFRASLQ